MGKNKDLRKIIRGLEAHIGRHKLKIEDELAKDAPSAGDLHHWRLEIKVAHERIARLKHRIRKDGRDAKSKS